MDSAMKTPKREWERPRLISLVRSRPEEAVLSACKYTSGTGAAGPSAAYNRCTTGASWRCTSECSILGNT
jgi:hypothetical protein